MENNKKEIQGGNRQGISPVPRYPLNRSPIRSTKAPQMSIPISATYKTQSETEAKVIVGHTQ